MTNPMIARVGLESRARGPGSPHCLVVPSTRLFASPRGTEPAGRVTAVGPVARGRLRISWHPTSGSDNNWDSSSGPLPTSMNPVRPSEWHPHESRGARPNYAEEVSDVDPTTPQDRPFGSPAASERL